VNREELERKLRSLKRKKKLIDAQAVAYTVIACDAVSYVWLGRNIWWDDFRLSMLSLVYIAVISIITWRDAVLIEIDQVEAQLRQKGQS